MATLAELAAFAAQTSYAVPYVDYQVGLPPATTLKDYHKLPASGAAITYAAATNTVYVKGDNLLVSGYDFSGTTVVVIGNNVTVQNSKFDAAFGWYALTQQKGFSGLVVDHNTFDGLKLDKEYARFINSGEGKITIKYNEFKNAQTDAVELTHGTVDHNYFSSTGYQTGAHADAIWVYKTTGPVSITNNFVDSRQASDALVAPNNAVQIVNKFGDVSNVTVTKNILLGGSYTVNVNDITDYKITNVVLKDNFVAAGLYGDLYPFFKPVDLVYADNGATAITADIKPAAIAKAGQQIKGKAGVANEVLQGTDGSDHVYGHGDSNVLIGGGGRDFLFGGKGVDVFAFKTAGDSAGKLTDYINNFEAGIDKIDLSAVANEAKGGHLSFIGGGAFTGVGGQVHTMQSGTSTWVEVDLNGDKAADMRIELAGLKGVGAGDFMLGASAPTTSPPITSASNTPGVTTPAAISNLGQQIKGKAGVANEVLQGTDGSDHVYGHGDSNVLIGGGGRDFLFGGKGVDVFAFKTAGDSAGKLTDYINNFEAGIDKIDLSAVANEAKGGHLSFIGGGAFTGVGGQVHTMQSGTSTWVEVDLNGDKAADMRIELAGLKGVGAGDFML